MIDKHSSATLLHLNPPKPRPRDRQFQMVTSDVADVLGYRAASNFTTLVSDDYKGLAQIETLGGPQEMVIVSELGLYEGLAFLTGHGQAVSGLALEAPQGLPEGRTSGPTCIVS
ncbi:BRO family protein [Salinibacter ruber]|uniref:BRO family protein n=1 Tax=Salinibacter ruber TaxID=146919 RepID=UPI003C6E3FB4